MGGDEPARGFYLRRQLVEIGGHHLDDIDFRQYANVSRTIGAVVSSRLASLAELQTIYGSEDLADMIEILAVDAANQRLVMQQNKRGG